MADLYALHWNAVTHANEYTVEVNPGGSGWATLGTTSGTQYTVVNTSTAYQSNIKYRVKAKDTTGVYDDSPYSEELSVTYYSITNTLTNCTSDNIQQMVANGFTYNSIITGGDGYIIGSDNWNITIGGTSDKTKGTLSSDGKTLNVAILSANGNIVITASAALEAPAAPTITLSGSTISWAAVTGATKYGIAATKDGITQQAETVNLSYDLSTWSALTVGTWSISVKSGKENVWSASSNTVTYTVQNKLATPTIAMNADGKTLEITDVENATSYDVYVDGTLKTNVAKAPAGQKITTLSIEDSASFKDKWDIYIKFDGVASPTNYDARFRNLLTSGESDRIYYNGVWSAEYADVTVDITATQWSAYVAEQQYSNAVYPCSSHPSFLEWVSTSTNGKLYPMGTDNNKFVVHQPAD